MEITLFICFIFLHIAFGLGFAFFILFFSVKTEYKILKYFGFLVSALLILLAFISIILGMIFVIKKPSFIICPYKNEEIMEHCPQIMQQKNDEANENDNDKNMSQKEKKDILTGKACPSKTKEEIENEMMKGEKTGAACRID